MGRLRVETAGFSKTFSVVGETHPVGVFHRSDDPPAPAFFLFLSFKGDALGVKINALQHFLPSLIFIPIILTHSSK